jgi:hypothetical protein
MNNMFINGTSFNQNLGNWVIKKVTDMAYMLDNSGLEPLNYEKTLIGWANQIPDIQETIKLGVVGLEYCSSEATEARQRLVNYGWIISGDANTCRSVQAKSLAVFPNPGKNIVTVSMGAVDIKEYTIQLKDLSGRVLINQVGNATLDVSNLKKGVYIIQISNKVQKETIQFIKG